MVLPSVGICQVHCFTEESQYHSHTGHLWGKCSLPANVQVDEDTQLERLLLAKNSFTGKIRLVLHSSTNCKFQGAIPEAIDNLFSVKYLNLRENNLTDTIPSSIGNLPYVDALFLGNNELQGELPASIGNLRTLQLLGVGSNELTSAMPSSCIYIQS